MINRQALIVTSRRLNKFLRFFGLQRHVKQPIWKKYDVERIIDVGVANGTDYLISNYPKAKFFLIEPNPIYVKQLTKKFLPSYNCVLIPVAAGSREERLELAIDGLESTFNYNKSKSAKKYLVDVRPLDSLLEEQDFFEKKGNSLLKIDTEGFEVDVLKGAKKLLNAPYLRAVIVEIVPKNISNRSNLSDIIVLLHKYNFIFDQIVKFRLRPSGVSYIDMAFTRRYSE